MGLRTYTLLLTGAAQRLSDVYGGTPGEADPRTDITYRAIYLQGLLANSSVVFVGMDATVSSSNHGFRVSAADTDHPTAIEPASPGSPLHLSDFYVLGAGGETLCVAGIPL